MTYELVRTRVDEIPSFADGRTHRKRGSVHAQERSHRFDGLLLPMHERMAAAWAADRHVRPGDVAGLSIGAESQGVPLLPTVVAQRCGAKPRPVRPSPRRAAHIRNRAIHCLIPCDFVLTTLWAGASLTEPAANPLVYLIGAQ